MRKYIRNAGLLSVLMLCLVCFSFVAQAHDNPSPLVGNELNYDHSGFSINQAIQVVPDFGVILQVPSVADDTGPAASLSVTNISHDVPTFIIHDLYAVPPNLKRQNGDSKSYGNLKYGYNAYTTLASPGNILPAPRFNSSLCGIDLDRLCYTSNVSYNMSGLALNQTCDQSARFVVMRC